MTKNPKAISFEQKITAIVFAMITEILFISVGVGAFYYKQYALGSVFIFISIIFILILLSKYISRAFKRYTLKTSDDELYKIKSLIESFKQSRNWPTEAGYQAELYDFLKQQYPNAKLEEEGGASRPDIVINDIAIELKGPTTDENIKIIRQLSALIFTIFAKRISLRSF